MKKFTPPALVTVAILSALAAIPITGCKPQPSVTPDQQELEIQRRVAQKLAEEKVAQQQTALEQKAQDLAAREQQVAQREQATVQQPPATPQTQSADLAANDTPVDDQVGGAASSSYDVFYSSLAGAGDWFEAPEYGPVWQPTVAANDPGWRPYTAGHWAYSDDIGWTWMSDEPFGWATYHYGRWTRLVGTGWVWIPGTQWAPAWVSWRHSDDYVGWAPLPPESRVGADVAIGENVDSEYGIAPTNYAFVPFASFGDSDLREEIIAPQENVTIINTTMNITNIRVRGTVVFNKGLSIAAVQRGVRHHIDIVKTIPRKDRSPNHTHSGDGVLEIPGSIVHQFPGRVQGPNVKKHLPHAVVDRSILPPSNTHPQAPVATSSGTQPQVPIQRPNAPVRPAPAAWTTPSAQPPRVPAQSPTQPSGPTDAIGHPALPQRPTMPARPAPTPWTTPSAQPPRVPAQPPTQPSGQTDAIGRPALPQRPTMPARQAAPTPWTTPSAQPPRVPAQPAQTGWTQPQAPARQPSAPNQQRRITPEPQQVERPRVPVQQIPQSEARQRPPEPARERAPEPARQQPAAPPHPERPKEATSSDTPKDKKDR